MGGSKKQTVGYRYFMGLHFGLCHGPVDALMELRGGDRTAWTGNVASSQPITIDAPGLWGGEKKEGGIVGDMDVMMGEADQGQNSYLVEQLGGNVPGFRGILSLVFRKGMVGAMNPYPKPWKFKVRRILRGWHGDWGADPCWYPSKAEIGIIMPPSVAVYLAIDLSESMQTIASNGQTRLANMKTSLAAALDVISAGIAAGTRVDIMVVGFGDYPGTRTSTIERSAGVADVESVKAWINSRAAPWGTYFPAGTMDMEGFFAGAPADALRLAFFVTDGEPSDRFTSETPMEMAQAAAAHVAAVDGLTCYGVNIDLPNTTFTAVVANAPTGVLRVDGGRPEQLTAVLRNALFGGLLAMNPAHIVYEALTNPDWGLGYPEATLDLASFQSAADVFHAEGLGLCGQWTRQDTIEGFIQDVMDHAGAVLAQDPRTSLFRIMPIRGGYTVADLPDFRRGLNVVSVEAFERAAITEAVNEVTVQYLDAGTGKQGSVTVQHLANIQAQGGVAAQTVRYQLCPSAGLAQRMGLRDLAAKAQPLCKTRLQVDRSAYGILPGQVVRWSDEKLGIVDMPMRVLQVNYGNLTAGAIQLDLAEDVFGLPATTYMGQQPAEWQEPDTAPQASPQVEAFEVPFVAIHRGEGASVANALAPSAGFLGMAAAKPPGLSYGYSLHARPDGGEYEETGAGEWTPGGILAAAVGPGDTALALGAASALGTIEPGELAMLGSGQGAELVRIDAVDVAAGVVTVGRGVGDTVPPQDGWPVGTRLWAIESGMASGVTEYADGEDVEAKAVTRAPGGELPLAAAPTGAVTMAQRAARPYPPGLFRINDEAYPGLLYGLLTVTWANRDRLLQADQLIDQEAASMGPEPGTTYTMRAYLDDVLVDTQDGITGTSATFTPSANGRVRIEVEAVRDGLESWHMQAREFSYTIDPTNPRVTTSGDRRVTVTGHKRTAIG